MPAEKIEVQDRNLNITSTWGADFLCVLIKVVSQSSVVIICVLYGSNHSIMGIARSDKSTDHHCQLILQFALTL